MNPLSDVLGTLRLTGGIFLDCEFTAPWCVSASAIGPEEVGLLTMPFPAHVIAYHYVTHGRVLLQIASEAGYDSEAAFSRAFKREFGIPPAAWRARSGDSPSRWTRWKSALTGGH